MNSLDIFVIIGIALFFVLGFRDGFSKKIFGFCGIWGGLIASIKLLDPVCEVLRQWLDFSPEVSVVVAFFVIFFICVLGVNILYRWFGKSASDTISIRMRIFGGILGLGQGVVTVSLILLMLSLFDSPSDEDKKSSVLYKKTIGIAPFVFDYSTRWLPSSKAFFDEIKAKIETFNVPHN